VHGPDRKANSRVTPPADWQRVGMPRANRERSPRNRSQHV